KAHGVVPSGFSSSRTRVSRRPKNATISRVPLALPPSITRISIRSGGYVLASTEERQRARDGASLRQGISTEINGAFVTGLPPKRGWFLKLSLERRPSPADSFLAIAFFGAWWPK